MQKEYRTETIEFYDEVLNENGDTTYEPTGYKKDVIITVLIADEGKHFVDRNGYRLGNRIEVGTEDSEDNYTEVKEWTQR